VVQLGHQAFCFKEELAEGHVKSPLEDILHMGYMLCRILITMMKSRCFIGKLTHQSQATGLA
jgi:glycopeptide antibiotics resistance protein